MKWGEENLRKFTLAIIAAFCLLIIGVAVGMTIKNTFELRGLLEQSIRAQLVSSCDAAREIVDDYDFTSYTDAASIAADQENYDEMLRDLRLLATRTGSAYIYGLRMENGQAVFFFDIDTENNELFNVYELSDIHSAAFAGHDAVGIFNMEDDYGSFHTAAVPLYQNGLIAGIVAVDIEDSLLTTSYKTSNRNIAVLIIILVVVMATLLLFMNYLLNRIRKMQGQLQQMAHYDAVTGLPNRLYLFEYLNKLLLESGGEPFAIFFIDLDNFKLVNDNAGHDAGDALLKSIGEFLQARQPVAKAFRPAAGVLNVSARVGGDEFIQVVPGLANEQQVMNFANTMLTDFAASDFNRHISEYAVGMSIGIALYPFHSEDYNVLIKYADIAMYHAKRAGKNRAVLYTDNLAAKDDK